MIAIVPMEGLVHVYDPSTIPVFRHDGAVKVNLTLDNKPIGWVMFVVNAPVTNARATEATYLLTGAYIRIQGEAMFDVLDERLLSDVVSSL